MTASHEQLDRSVIRWIHSQGWTGLRDIQSKAIKPILAGNTDVLISASTAAGKTEAFFLPACSALLKRAHPEEVGILYISPLKALINDQYRRLESLCDTTGLSAIPWHGDSPQGKKKQFERNPEGILLITPESLESLLIRKAGWLKTALSSLAYVVIDEFHAFIGMERGMQLLSLLNRLEHLLGRLDTPIPRVALSATLGDLEQVPKSLRPNGSMPCQIIVSTQSQTTLKTQVRGYINPAEPPDGVAVFSADDRICQDLYELCRGDSHLIFANSRGRTELFASHLSDLCEQEKVPNEFFPHHGSLAKELRETLEARLQKENLPTTAVCTMTLELGIDIGKVNSVVQVNAPHSVSSLRQRMGRSGRRGGPSILRGLIAEEELTTSSDIRDRLRIQLVQTLAMFRLLIASKWYEPADTRQFHFSTLLHQILAITAQWGGTRADQLFYLLCKTGPFNQVNTDHFKTLLIQMGSLDLLTQLSSGELVLGKVGEHLVDHYTFYAVFKTPEEFRIVSGSKSLGTIPIDSPILPDQHIIFGGRYWLVKTIDVEKKVIDVAPTKGGKPPKFGGGGMSIHARVREEMRRLYISKDYRIEVGANRVEFMDETGRSLFNEGVKYFHDLKLSDISIVEQGKNTYVFPWHSDQVTNTLSVLLAREGFKSYSFAGVIEVQDASAKDISTYFTQLRDQNLPMETELADSVPEKMIHKYDDYLSDNLLNENYGRIAFNCKDATRWIQTNFRP